MNSISVIIPYYNNAATIGAAVASVRAQTLRPDEIIVIDDASEEAFVDNALAGGIPMRIIRLERNRGPAGARNAGIAAAHGDWIAFLDADDEWLPRKLELQVAVVAEHPAAVLVASAAGAADGTEERRRVCSLNIRDFAIRNPVITSTVLVRKSTLQAAGGFDEQFRGPEDYDLWVRVASAAGAADGTEDRRRVFSLNQPLILYRTRSGSLSMDDRLFLPQVLRVLDKAYGHGGALAGLKRYERRARAHQYAGASWMAFRRDARGRALYLLAASCFWRPWMAAGQRWKLLVRYLAGRGSC